MAVTDPRPHDAIGDPVESSPPGKTAVTSATVFTVTETAMATV
jgi:hypothetical protein